MSVAPQPLELPAAAAAGVIAQIRTQVVRAAYRRPFRISSGVSTELVSLVVEVETTEGLVGVGETSPMTAYTGETLAGVRAAIEEHLVPALIGHDPLDRAGAHLLMDTALRGQHVAKSGIDIALHDLAGLLSGWPVHVLLGGSIRSRVETAWVVGLGTLDEMAAEAAEYADRGFRHLKVKGGKDPAADLELVRAVLAALPPGAELCLDANEGYDAATALPVLAKMADAGLALVEQPLPRWDLAGLVRLRERLDLRLMVDESMQSLQDALEIVRRGAADVLNIKILKVGGLHRALQIAHLAEAAGLAVKVGSMPELGVATLAAVHLAAAVPGATVPADLVGPLLVREEPLAPKTFSDVNGWVEVPTRPGLGHDL
ncbi:mandelate racemase/muconate lactonizing enzyme family protein [Kribbella sp. CA-293567]|uniref:mandelate racemase/muconate lactonizing enzyme family protein n=1 Tax=Kribbella sp. CA-293567 TaxID=3002436 RepID=UPI0022DE3180|nr:enolase C-terminal domain-like protein [Kribbella sp. CA-293567]WBQ04249.1 dipeptide epimerase [Kribbella sp. CA-293567]